MVIELNPQHEEIKEGPVCPVCGSIGICTHEYNVRGEKPSDVLDRYTFNCAKCDTNLEQIINAWDSGHPDDLSKCPYCGKDDS